METQVTQTQQNSVSMNAGTEVEHGATLFAEPVIQTPYFSITNALLTSWVAVLVIVIISFVIRKNLKKVPGKLQHAFEFLIEGALSLCDQVTGNRSLSKKIFPLAFSIFLFVLVNNWLGLLPIGALGVVQTHEGVQTFVPFLRSGTADVNTTLAFGLMVVIGANIFGVVAIGIWKFFNKFINLKALANAAKNVRKEPTQLLVGPITFFVGLLEIIGEIAKVASLSFRLFGNVFAGEVLLLSMTLIFAYGLPIPFIFLEVLVGVIQALIFAMLTLVYFTIASQDHEAHDGHEMEHEIENVVHA
jgi:F-type H+-transporting ATPase subunit a